MNYFSEKDIRDLVCRIVAESRQTQGRQESGDGDRVPVEISGRHVHLDRKTTELLFGPGHELTPKRDLSQPGQFLAEERVKIVTPAGQLENVAVLGPFRDRNQVELSLSDANGLKIKPPVRLSGDLQGAADVFLIGLNGVVMAKESTIVAKAHIHMTPADARRYGVADGEQVSVCLDSGRPVTLNDVIIRVSEQYALAVHVDFDEANAAQIGRGMTGLLQKNR